MGGSIASLTQPTHILHVLGVRVAQPGNARGVVYMPMTAKKKKPAKRKAAKKRTARKAAKKTTRKKAGRKAAGRKTAGRKKAAKRKTKRAKKAAPAVAM